MVHVAGWGLANGVYAGKGRPASINVSRVRALKAQGMGPTEIARELCIGRATLLLTSSLSVGEHYLAGNRSARCVDLTIDDQIDRSQSRDRIHD
jgi:hypothetical protein